MGIFDQFYEKAKSLFGESKGPYKKKDYYELLEVEIKATDDEIKKSYRKMALKWHPDKNPGKEEECAAYFTLLQQAYEVLMDPRERAFYDKHKDNILREQDATEETRDEGIKLFQYFQPCFKGFGDDPQGFYSVYREVFDRLATEEFPYLDDDDEHNFPTFGRSDSGYDMVVAPFYDFWTNFSTSRTFAWLDKWNLRDAPNRQTLRAMEKDNRKLRDAAKDERNDEIRSLATYIRKRDKRVKAFRDILEERKKKAQEQAEARRKQKLRENLEQLGEHVVDEEVKQAHLQSLKEIENALDAEFGIIKDGGSDDSEGSNEEATEFCIVCDKSFKTAKSYANHQKSKKHKQSLEELRKHMKDEDALLLQEEEQVEEEETPRKKGKTKKQRKKGKGDEPILNDEEQEAGETIAEEVADKLKVEDDHEKETEVKDEMADEHSSQVGKEEVVDGKPKLGKAKMRRAAKAEAKKREEEQEEKPSGPTEAIPSECQVCGLDFNSRSKLFKHIEATGHAILKTENPNQKAKKKGKR